MPRWSQVVRVRRLMPSALASCWAVRSTGSGVAEEGGEDEVDEVIMGRAVSFVLVSGIFPCGPERRSEVHPVKMDGHLATLGFVKHPVASCGKKARRVVSCGVRWQWRALGWDEWCRACNKRSLPG